MEKEERKQRRKNRKICNFVALLFIIVTVFLIYNILLLGPIEVLLRYLVISILVLMILRCLISRTIVIRNSKKKVAWFSFIHTFFAILFLVISIYIFTAYNSVNAFNKNKTTYSTSIVVLKDSALKKKNQIQNKKIGMINDSDSYEGNTLALLILQDEKLLDKNKVVEYDDYHDLLEALYSKKVDVAFFPTNYVSMFDNLDGYKNIDKETRIIYTKQKKVKKNSSVSTIDKPFSVLLMGIDSTSTTLNPSETGNSDSLMVLSFNPDTLSATMLSIPRDSYVNVSCMSRKTKITHAGWYGEECVEKTIEDFLDIDIDYYVKVNFKALVNIVNAVGGIEVEVPKNLCTDNSSRHGKICIKKGKQTLNGEEALVLARNRKQLANGDIDRGLNQQLVVKALVNKVAKKVKDISTMYNLLDTISDSMDTNFSTDQILSFYNIGKNIVKKSNKDLTDSLTIRQLYLSGEGKLIYDEKTRLNLYNYVLYNESIEAVSNAINANMEKKDFELIKTFKWSIDEDYESKPIGKISSGTTSSVEKNNSTTTRKETVTLPNFVGKTKEKVQSWCSKNNVYVQFSYIESSSYTEDQVISQNIASGTDIKTISSLKITLAKAKEKTSEETSSSEENNNITSSSEEDTN